MTARPARLASVLVFILVATASVVRAAPAEKAADPVPPRATRIAFITLGDQSDNKDMIGPYVNDAVLRESMDAIEELPDAEKPDIVVLWVDSGGGHPSETRTLIRTIQEEIKPRYRTVVWVRSAISAACMVSLVFEEIYMMSNAPIGAATGFYGMHQVGGHREFERMRVFMEDVSRWGKHDPFVMRAMMTCQPQDPRNDLTADIDEHGEVTWYDGPEGEHMVCPKDRILAMNAKDAVRFGIAVAVADTKDQLAEAMGSREWVEVGQAADEIQVRHRANYKAGETQAAELMKKMEVEAQSARDAESEPERNGHIGRALAHLREFRDLVQKNPMLGEFEHYNEDWFEHIKERLKALRAGP